MKESSEEIIFDFLAHRTQLAQDARDLAVIVDGSMPAIIRPSEGNDRFLSTQRVIEMFGKQAFSQGYDLNNGDIHNIPRVIFRSMMHDVSLDVPGEDQMSLVASFGRDWYFLGEKESEKPLVALVLGSIAPILKAVPYTGKINRLTRAYLFNVANTIADQTVAKREMGHASREVFDFSFLVDSVAEGVARFVADRVPSLDQRELYARVYDTPELHTLVNHAYQRGLDRPISSKKESVPQ